MREVLGILAVLALSAAVVFVAFAIGRNIYENRQTTRRKRELFGEDSEAESILAPPEAPEPKTALGRMDRSFDRLVTETGLGIDSAQALGIMALCAATLGAIPIVLREDFLLAALGVLVGIALPLLFFVFQRSQYRNRIQNQLPDAFFLMARSLRAGQNLEQAMGTVAAYGTKPLAGEFKRVVDQVELGLAPPAALQTMSRRLNLIDFNTLVTAVTLHRTVGGNLAALLDRVATSARDRNQFRGYFRAATALARITGFAIAAAPLLLLIGYATFQPEFVDRFTTSTIGMRALLLVGILEVVGIVWMISLLRTDY